MASGSTASGSRGFVIAGESRIAECVEQTVHLLLQRVDLNEPVPW
jgi:hypothetical protein